MLTWYSILFCFLASSQFVWTLLLPKLIMSIKLIEWYLFLRWGCHILCMKLRKKLFLSPSINLFMIKICWDTSVHSFNWWIPGFIYYCSVLLLSNKEYGTRFHPRVSGSLILISAWIFNSFFSEQAQFM